MKTNAKKYVAAGLAVLATINPVLAQVKLPNGETTSPALVQLSPWYGQDNNDGSGAVLGSAHQAASGAYTIYIYTGNNPQNWVWGRVPLNPSVVPPSAIMAKCTASIAAVYAENDRGGTYAYGYDQPDWPFPTTIEIDGGLEINGQFNVNIFAVAAENLIPWCVYVINLNCPPVPPPGGTND